MPVRVAVGVHGRLSTRRIEEASWTHYPSGPTALRLLIALHALGPCMLWDLEACAVRKLCGADFPYVDQKISYLRHRESESQMGRKITFSFKATGSRRLNDYVASVATQLRKMGFQVEMRHGSGGFASGYGVNADNWEDFWKDRANESDFVVCFDDADYMESEFCQLEFRFAKSNYVDHYISVGRYMEDKDPKEMAEHIKSKFPRRG